jgi:adenylate cyclase class 2
MKRKRLGAVAAAAGRRIIGYRACGMTETEVKIPWERPVSDALVFIESHGYRLIAPRTLEIDQLFDRPSGELRQSGLILRLRQAAEVATVTYKGPASRETYKSREEIEFDVSDPEAFQTVLNRLGYQPRFRYEKYRTEFSDPVESGLIMLDETPVGVFLELEGLGAWIDRTASRLGFSKADYSTASYYSIYQLHREKNPAAPPDMTFGLEAFPGAPAKQP